MTRHLRSAFALVLLVCVSASAQSTADVATIDGIMRAYYEVVSGPTGAVPDRARDESLHMPAAHVGLARQTGGDTAIDMTTLAGYYERHGGVRKAPFYEWELSRQTRQFGNIAHVWSTYAVGSAPGGPAERRGVTSLQLYFDGTRWWITGWMSEVELPARAIPPDLLPAASASTAGTADDAAIREVVRRYVNAREARDAEAVAALFMPDADQLVSSGEWRRGRDVLVKGTMASSARTTGTRTVVVETIRMIDPDVAIADGRYEISGAETRKMWSTFVMARQQGQWRISAIRNMLPAPPAK